MNLSRLRFPHLNTPAPSPHPARPQRSTSRRAYKTAITLITGAPAGPTLHHPGPPQTQECHQAYVAKPTYENLLRLNTAWQERQRPGTAEAWRVAEQNTLTLLGQPQPDLYSAHREYIANPTYLNLRFLVRAWVRHRKHLIKEKIDWSAPQD